MFICYAICVAAAARRLPTVIGRRRRSSVTTPQSNSRNRVSGLSTSAVPYIVRLLPISHPTISPRTVSNHRIVSFSPLPTAHRPPIPNAADGTPVIPATGNMFDSCSHPCVGVQCIIFFFPTFPVTRPSASPCHMSRMLPTLARPYACGV